MRTSFSIGPLETADVTRAYAIVLHLAEPISLDDWQRAFSSEVRRRRWLTVRDAAGVVRGLCHFYRVKLGRGYKLEVPVFSVFSLVQEADMARDLIGVLREKAVQSGCDVIHFWPAARVDLQAIWDRKRPSVPDCGVNYDLRASGLVSS